MGEQVVAGLGCFSGRSPAGEATPSFPGRIADRYGLTVRILLSSATEVAGQQGVAAALQGDSEVFLNAAARAPVAAPCHAPQVGLRRALPAWTREEPLGPSKERPAARLRSGVETVAAWGPACPGCAATRTGRVAPARVCLAAHRRVCPRHRCWLMSVPGSGAVSSGWPDARRWSKRRRITTGCCAAPPSPVRRSRSPRRSQPGGGRRRAPTRTGLHAARLHLHENRQPHRSRRREQ